MTNNHQLNDYHYSSRNNSDKTYEYCNYINFHDHDNQTRMNYERL